jgi:hypothetical protein
MSDYQVAIPSYQRSKTIYQKTLTTLLNGKVNPNKITIFVANQQEKEEYETNLPKSSYKEIIIGEKGITPQRIFISKHYPANTHIFSVDDDIRGFYEIANQPLSKLYQTYRKTHSKQQQHQHNNSHTRNKKRKTQKKKTIDASKQRLKPITNLDHFIKTAFHYLEKEKLHIWGVYPTSNPFFMKPKITTDLRFIIGASYGYINRPNVHDLFPKTPLKGDYEQTILYYKKDGGVLRFNNVSFKTHIYAKGGLDIAQKRIQSSKKATEYLLKKYPEYVVPRPKRKNQISEIGLIKDPNLSDENISTSSHA